MKLIIEIDEYYFEIIKHDFETGAYYKPFEIIANGKPYEERPQGDLISRKHLYRRIKTECNPYGKPTIDFESGKRVLDIIDNEPTVETYTEEDMRGDKNG